MRKEKNEKYYDERRPSRQQLKEETREEELEHTQVKAKKHVRNKTKNRHTSVASYIENNPTLEVAETPSNKERGNKIPTEKGKSNKQIAKEKGKNEANKKPALGKIRVIPLGGIGEIGKNMTVVEYNNDMVVIDCGLGFPDEDMPGIDLVIPDFTYLEKNKDRLRGVLLTHGHEDHIGGIPYFLKSLNVPIYGTPLTLGIIKNKLEEFELPNKPDFRTVKAGDRIKLGEMTAEFIHVNHSIADACAIALHTPLGILVHTGDFKLDTTPIDGEMMDVVRLGELGKEGVKLLMCESTNAERPGYTPSEKKVGASLEAIFASHSKKRIIIATFSSNVHRVQQVIDTAVRHKRKVAVTGRSMNNILAAATELGYMKIPQGELIPIEEIRKYRPCDLVIVTTGSQGEPMSALYRMAYGNHQQVTLDQNDLVVFSANAIPGNEKLVGNIINELTHNNIEVYHDASMGVHVSGHACQEELKFMQGLCKPKYFMPIHGEARHLSANRDLAKFMGMSEDNIFIPDLGRVLEIDKNGAKWNGNVPAGKVLVDGSGDVENDVLRDRLHLSQDGIIVVVASVEFNEKMLLSGPDIISRGFVFMKDAEDMMQEAKEIASKIISACLSTRGKVDRMQMKRRIKEELTSFFYSKTKKKPMILPMVMDL